MSSFPKLSALNKHQSRAQCKGKFTIVNEAKIPLVTALLENTSPGDPQSQLEVLPLATPCEPIPPPEQPIIIDEPHSVVAADANAAIAEDGTTDGVCALGTTTGRLIDNNCVGAVECVNNLSFDHLAQYLGTLQLDDGAPNMTSLDAFLSIELPTPDFTLIASDLIGISRLNTCALF